jgi:hypothetical protein
MLGEMATNEGWDLGPSAIGRRSDAADRPDLADCRRSPGLVEPSIKRLLLLVKQIRVEEARPHNRFDAVTPW